MRKAVRLFLFIEAIAFIAAGLTHFGVLMHGYEHRPAGTAESVIGAVLLIGFLLTWLLPRSTRGSGLAVQTFAFLGTCVGIYTIAVGVGPRTVPDIAFHVIIVLVLLSGLVVAFRAKNAPRQSPQS